MSDGLIDKAKGKLKEALGSVADNKDLEAEGKLDQAKGHGKDALENVRSSARRATADAKDAIAEKLRQHSENAEEKSEKLGPA